MQASRASDQASGTRPSPADTQIEDRRSDRRRSFQRQADQRSGHRTAGHLQGGLRQRPRRGWRPGRSAGGPPPGGPGGPPPADDASSSDDTLVDASTSIDDILKQFLQSLQESLSASSSTSYGATGTASSEQQRLVLGAADRLPELTFSRPLRRSCALQPSFPDRKGWLSYFPAARNRCAVAALVRSIHVWRVQWQATS